MANFESISYDLTNLLSAVKEAAEFPKRGLGLAGVATAISQLDTLIKEADTTLKILKADFIQRATEAGTPRFVVPGEVPLTVVVQEGRDVTEISSEKVLEHCIAQGVSREEIVRKMKFTEVAIKAIFIKDVAARVVADAKSTVGKGDPTVVVRKATKDDQEFLKAR